MCCSSLCFRVLLCTHYGPLQCFSTYFRKLKEIGVLRPIFPDYVNSCDYDLTVYITQEQEFYQLRGLHWKTNSSMKLHFWPNGISFQKIRLCQLRKHLPDDIAKIRRKLMTQLWKKHVSNARAYPAGNYMFKVNNRNKNFKL